MTRILLILWLFAVSVGATRSIDRDQAIEIATQYVRTWPTIDLSSLKVAVEHRTGPPDDALPAARRYLAHRSFGSFISVRVAELFSAAPMLFTSPIQVKFLAGGDTNDPNRPNAAMQRTNECLRFDVSASRAIPR
jgi:hypothetical protein